MSRNEQVQLWGYDQNALVDHSRFNELTFQQLTTDFRNVRKGMARQHKITLENFLKSIIGHEMHHINGIKEKYL